MVVGVLAGVAEIVVPRVREGIVKVMMAALDCNECNSAEQGDPLPFVGLLGALGCIHCCSA